MMIHDFLSEGQVIVSSLLIKNYRKLGLDERELTLYLQLLAEEHKGCVRLDLQALSQNMELSIETVYQLLSKMEHKGIIQMESHQTEDGKVDDWYNIYPLYQKLESLYNQQQKPKVQPVNTDLENRLVMKLEQELARPLSSDNLRQIEIWVCEDHFDESLIYLAFKRALQLNAKQPFRYANRILESWKAQNITTEEDAMQDIRKNNRSREDQWVEQVNREQSQKNIKIPIIKEWK